MEVCLTRVKTICAIAQMGQLPLSTSPERPKLTHSHTPTSFSGSFARKVIFMSQVFPCTISMASRNHGSFQGYVGLARRETRKTRNRVVQLPIRKRKQRSRKQEKNRPKIEKSMLCPSFFLPFSTILFLFPSIFPELD